MPSFSPYISYAAGDFAGACTEPDLIALTNDDASAGEVNTTVLAASIKRIQELIDGKLRRITTVPLTTCPDLIKTLEAALVVDDLRLRRHKVRDMDQQALYKSLMGQLEEIASQKILLDLGGTSSVTEGVRFESGIRSVNDASFEESYETLMES